MENNNLSISYINEQINIAFERLIGTLTIMSKLKSYESSKNEINEILNLIIDWAVKFQSIHNLSFIDSNEILSVYKRMDLLKDIYLFDTKLGLEGELSDEIVIWIYELMELRKKQIEGEYNE